MVVGGKEKERGLFSGARYYVPWLGRWASVDQKVGNHFLRSYNYALNNPVILFTNMRDYQDEGAVCADRSMC
jgi:RHS repeat-associated protein